jgi:hypothetical protein
MTITALAMVFLAGAVLSARFNVLILPVIGLVAVGAGIALGNSVGAVLLIIALSAAALQMGYIFGVIMAAAIASLSLPQRIGARASNGHGRPDFALRLRAIQGGIGEALRLEFEPPQELPDRMVTLLAQIQGI